MTRLHLFGFCFLVVILLACGLAPQCKDNYPALERVIYVAIGAIAGDMRGRAKGSDGT